MKRLFSIMAAIVAATTVVSAQSLGNRLGFAATYNCRDRQFAPTAAIETGPWKNFLGSRFDLDTIGLVGTGGEAVFAGGAVGKFVNLGRTPWVGEAKLFGGVGVFGDFVEQLSKMKFDVRLMVGLQFKQADRQPSAETKVVYIGDSPRF